jgi:hypothetical protein
VRLFAPEVPLATLQAVDVPAGPQDPARPIEDAALAETDDELKAGRGFSNAILLAVPLWGLIGLLTWLVVR